MWELLDAKQSFTGNLDTAKVEHHQDNENKLNELFFLERMSIQCNSETNSLIKEKIDSAINLAFLFQFNSPAVLNKLSNSLFW